MTQFEQQGNEFLLEMSRKLNREGKIYHDLYMACNKGEQVVLNPSQREHIEKRVKQIAELKKIGNFDLNDFEKNIHLATVFTLEESLATYINTCRG